MGLNTVVLAKSTVCRYSASGILVYNTSNKNSQSSTMSLEFTITKKGELTVKKTSNEGDNYASIVPRTDFITAKNFIRSNGKTACPSQLAVVTSPHLKPSVDYATGVAFNTYETYVFTTVGNFSNEQISKMKDITGDATKSDASTAYNKKNDNVNMKTDIKGSFEKNQSSVVKPETASPQELIGCGLLGENTLNIIKKLFRFSRFAIPILVIILGLTDFLGVVFSGEEKNFKEAGNRFVKRLMAGVLIVFVPYILTMLINISGIPGDYDLKTDELFCAFNGASGLTIRTVADHPTTDDCTQYNGNKEECTSRNYCQYRDDNRKCSYSPSWVCSDYKADKCPEGSMDSTGRSCKINISGVEEVCGYQ